MNALTGMRPRRTLAGDIAGLAQRFAALPADEAERSIEAEAHRAIAEWRVADATFWQRVKFRSRLLRARRAVAAAV